MGTVQTILRAKATVEPGGRVTISDPALRTGEAVEVLILLSVAPDDPHLSALEILNDAPGKRHFQTAEEVANYLREERGSWDS